jgi:hypothetical protein
VRFLFLARVLFALLAFQLAVGLQVGVARAAMPMVAGPPHASGQTTALASMQTPAQGTDIVVSVGTSASGLGTTTDACPMHTTASHAVTQDQTAQNASHADSSRDAPRAHVPLHTPGKHDCCKSSGCQGQCGNALLAFNVTAARSSPASTRVRPISTERAVVAPADTHFRPPILS